MRKLIVYGPAPLCECGCGEVVTTKVNSRWARFRFYHAARIQPKGPSAHHWKSGTSKKEGYVLVFLPGHHRAGRGKYVRRCILVAEEKLGRQLLPGEVVHHINAIRDDDRPENIHVSASQSEHMSHHNTGVSRARKITAEDAKEIKALLRQGAISTRAIARRFDISQTTVAGIRDGRTWRAVS